MELRPSTYNIRVETHDPDHVLLVHGYTKAIDLVSRRVADLIDDCTKGVDLNALGEANAAALHRRGHLTAKTPEEEKQGFLRLVGRLDAQKRLSMSPSFILMPTYLCNLNCFYCYQKPAIESDAELVKHRMTIELADKAFDAYEALLPEGKTLQGAKMTLYGGEPLLRTNGELLNHVIDKCRRYEMSVSAVTNGTHLHHHKALLGPGGIGAVQITLDGAKAQHDTRRIGRGKQGTFDIILDNIDVALEHGVAVNVRLNIDRNNLESLSELYGEFQTRGWMEHAQFSAYAKDLHMIEDQEEWMDKNELLDGSDIDGFIAEHGYNIKTDKNVAFDNLRGAVEGSYFAGLKTGYCGANYGMCIFDAKGNVYTCWEEVELFEPVGQYREGKVVFNEELRGAWNRSPVAANPLCHECSFAMYCGGGCDFHGKQEGQKYYDDFCPAFMQSFRTGIAEDYAVARIGVEKGVGVRAEDGRVSLSRDDRAAILAEVAQKLHQGNRNVCTSKCGSASAPEGLADIHRKRVARDKRALAVIAG